MTPRNKQKPQLAEASESSNHNLENRGVSDSMQLQSKQQDLQSETISKQHKRSISMIASQNIGQVAELQALNQIESANCNAVDTSMPVAVSHDQFKLFTKL